MREGHVGAGEPGVAQGVDDLGAGEDVALGGPAVAGLAAATWPRTGRSPGPTTSSTPDPAPVRLTGRSLPALDLVDGGQAPVGATASTIPAAPCLAPAQEPPRMVSEDASARGDRAVPPDWSWHADDEGFGIAVPPGWLRFTDGDVVCLQDPHQDRLLAVDLTVQRRTIPSDHWSAEADRLTEAGALPGYTRISIGPLIRPGGAAEWEYAWDGPDGERRHARRLLVNGTSPGMAYALTWVTPDATWTDSESVYRVLSGSFRRSA
ncbi:hypothetical protein EYA84_14225 [Verrucosispora sp. SN26_14.1]|nr:hypothetical protein [Verrucosispora sp. SN26_14.1]TBL35255.1 hypothetical protein EYA84_14225 [Verrucosispora sp. SN26_14.1]